MPEVVKAPELWGVWSENSESQPEWFNTKDEARDVARSIVQDNPTVTVHLYKATSVGTLSMTPLATGEMMQTLTVISGTTQASAG